MPTYPNRPVAVVAHSLGGLVVGNMLTKHSVDLRAFLGPVVTLGTPYGGSPESYLELQGWHGAPVLKVNANSLTSQVGANWTSPYELLPRWPFVVEKFGSSVLPYDSVYHGLADPMNFPALPRTGAITAAEALWAEQGPPQISNAYAIVGSGKPTPSGLTTFPQLLSNYNSTPPSCSGPGAIPGDGDGTVPTISAVPIGPLLEPSFVPTQHVRYIDELHAGLPSNADVISAVLQILSGQGYPSLPSLGATPSVMSSTWELLTCSPISMMVQDRSGNITSDQLEQITDSLAFRYGEHSQIWLPRGQKYYVQVNGTGTGKFNWFLHELNPAAGAGTQFSFVQVPVTPNSRGVVTLDDSGVSSLSYDYTGSGIVDTIPSNVVPPEVRCRACWLRADDQQTVSLSFDIGYVGSISTFSLRLNRLTVTSTRVTSISVSASSAKFSGYATIGRLFNLPFSVLVTQTRKNNILKLVFSDMEGERHVLSGVLHGALELHVGQSHL